MIFIHDDKGNLLTAVNHDQLAKGLTGINENLPIAYLKNNAINIPFCPKIAYHLAVNYILKVDTFINYKGESMPVDDLYDAINFLKDKFAYIDMHNNIDAT